MFTFAYARVSTADQTTENQLLELRSAGFTPDATYYRGDLGQGGSGRAP